jgi:hypothetical protein
MKEGGRNEGRKKERGREKEKISDLGINKYKKKEKTEHESANI